jgi:ABC-type amino acid transport substrate-binding protein
VILATAKPLSQETVAELRMALKKKRVELVFAPSAAIAQGLEMLERNRSEGLPRLGEKLLEREFIETPHLIEALRVQRFSPQPLGEILCEMGVLWPEDLKTVLEEPEEQTD